ncbi:DUF2790 domain-containing protein [Azotobacter vinelandii]|uniref:DUF2790 domain-containing protein n=1 Tax=Azotobacter vinelandii TaxID=354 RepID=UPI002666F808|nr:DUF2790 domain-containing protein [Azotobacter vinelandii]WKN21110.1 DUF2790 domain-containing protein [Azotobacter vinelandii]
MAIWFHIDAEHRTQHRKALGFWFSFGEYPCRILNAKSIKLTFAMAMLLPVSLAMAGNETLGSVVLDIITVYKQSLETHDYTCGVNMDIAEVVSIKYFPPKPNFCGVIPAVMTYDGSNGKLHAIRYLYPETKGCGN